MSSIGIKLDELLIEMERLAGESPDGFSAREMAKHYGRSVPWCRRKLRDLVEHEMVICSGQKRITRIDGGVGYIPVYRLVSGEN